MKAIKVQHHGNIRWRVNEPNGPGGKRIRKFFDSREAAEQYTKERKADRNAFGAHVTSISAKARAALPYHLERLNALGWTLAAAVDFIEKHGKAAPSMPLGTVADELLTAKKSA